LNDVNRVVNYGGNIQSLERPIELKAEEFFAGVSLRPQRPSPGAASWDVPFKRRLGLH
jgi:hypothetical protein